MLAYAGCHMGITAIQAFSRLSTCIRHDYHVKPLPASMPKKELAAGRAHMTMVLALYIHQACQQDLDTYQGIVAAVLILQRVLGRLTALWQDMLATQGRVGLPGKCLYIA